MTQIVRAPNAARWPRRSILPSGSTLIGAAFDVDLSGVRHHSTPHRKGEIVFVSDLMARLRYAQDKATHDASTHAEIFPSFVAWVYWLGWYDGSTGRGR